MCLSADAATLFSSSPLLLLLRLKGLAPTCLPEKYDLVAPANRRAATRTLSLGAVALPLPPFDRPTAPPLRNETKRISHFEFVRSSVSIVKCRRRRRSRRWHVCHVMSARARSLVLYVMRHSTVLYLSPGKGSRKLWRTIRINITRV